MATVEPDSPAPYPVRVRPQMCGKKCDYPDWVVTGLTHSYRLWRRDRAAAMPLLVTTLWFALDTGRA